MKKYIRFKDSFKSTGQANILSNQHNISLNDSDMFRSSNINVIKEREPKIRNSNAVAAKPMLKTNKVGLNSTFTLELESHMEPLPVTNMCSASNIEECRVFDDDSETDASKLQNSSVDMSLDVTKLDYIFSSSNYEVLTTSGIPCAQVKNESYYAEVNEETSTDCKKSELVNNFFSNTPPPSLPQIKHSEKDMISPICQKFDKKEFAWQHASTANEGLTHIPSSLGFSLTPGQNKLTPLLIDSQSSIFGMNESSDDNSSTKTILFDPKYNKKDRVEEFNSPPTVRATNKDYNKENTFCNQSSPASSIFAIHINGPGYDSEIDDGFLNCLSNPKNLPQSLPKLLTHQKSNLSKQHSVDSLNEPFIEERDNFGPVKPISIWSNKPYINFLNGQVPSSSMKLQEIILQTNDVPVTSTQYHKSPQKLPVPQVSPIGKPQSIEINPVSEPIEKISEIQKGKNNLNQSFTFKCQEISSDNEQIDKVKYKPNQEIGRPKGDSLVEKVSVTNPLSVRPDILQTLCQTNEDHPLTSTQYFHPPQKLPVPQVSPVQGTEINYTCESNKQMYTMPKSKKTPLKNKSFSDYNDAARPRCERVPGSFVAKRRGSLGCVNSITKKAKRKCSCSDVVEGSSSDDSMFATSSPWNPHLSNTNCNAECHILGLQSGKFNSQCGASCLTNALLSELIAEGKQISDEQKKVIENFELDLENLFRKLKCFFIRQGKKIYNDNSLSAKFLFNLKDHNFDEEFLSFNLNFKNLENIDSISNGEVDSKSNGSFTTTINVVTTKKEPYTPLAKKAKTLKTERHWSPALRSCKGKRQPQWWDGILDNTTLSPTSEKKNTKNVSIHGGPKYTTNTITNKKVSNEKSRFSIGKSSEKSISKNVSKNKEISSIVEADNIVEIRGKKKRLKQRVPEEIKSDEITFIGMFQKHNSDNSTDYYEVESSDNEIRNQIVDSKPMNPRLNKNDHKKLTMKKPNKGKKKGCEEKIVGKRKLRSLKINSPAKKRKVSKT